MNKVVIVDDDHTYLSLLRRAVKLEKLEANILVTGSAREFREVVSATENVRLVLMDVNLDGDETGFGLLPWLAGLPAPPQAVLQSSTVEPEDADRARALGSNLTLKANSFAVLRTRLQEWLAAANQKP